MGSVPQIILTTGIVLVPGFGSSIAQESSKALPENAAQVVSVVAEAKYLLSEIPPRLVWAEIYGDEAALGISNNTNVSGVVLEIVEPAEFAGKIYTLRGSPHLTNSSFAIGGRYEFRASVRSIGKFSFEQSTAIPARKLNSKEAEKEESFGPRVDDLEWLVGRWRCMTREWLIPMDGPLGSACEDALDYFNVYYPYADENLTLQLTDRPDDRPIAAEFMARHVRSWFSEPFEERLVPMMEPGPVRISKDRIWVGHPFCTVEFRYCRREGRYGPLLMLETKSMRLEFYKLHAAIGDIKNSFVEAPIKDYSAERVCELKQRYEQMRAKAADGGKQQEPGRPL